MFSDFALCAWLQIVCRRCQLVSEREEEFVSLSVDVKGHASLAQSLAAFVRGDLLEGDNAYHCSRCDRKARHLPAAGAVSPASAASFNGGSLIS